MPRIKNNFFYVYLWMFFTGALAIWWWVYGVRELKHSMIASAEAASKYKMLMAEGFILVILIIIGGSYLIYLLVQDQKRHQRLKFFFSTFTHDIKTSISRLRLQAEVIAEETHSSNVVRRLWNDIQKLDLQLENSLAFANAEEITIREKMDLKEIISVIRLEFPELSLEMTKNVVMEGDRKAFMVIFRNLLQNAVLHGQASVLRLIPEQISTNKVLLRIEDNGRGLQSDSKNLGLEPLASTHSHGNGLGLFIVRTLIQKMNGKVSFKNLNEKDQSGFVVEIEIRGTV